MMRLVRKRVKRWLIRGIRRVLLGAVTVLVGSLILFRFAGFSVTSLPVAVTLLLLTAMFLIFLGVSLEQRAEDEDAEVSPFAVTGEDIDERLKVLRREFYYASAPSMLSSTLRDVMRGVSKACTPYYRSLMLTERSVYTILDTAPVRGLEDPDALMAQVQRLSRHIAVLVEYIQLADQLVFLYEQETDEWTMVQETRQRLIRRADRAMQVLESVPARLLQLTESASDTGLTRLCRQLQNINTRLEGMAEAYAAMEQQYYFAEEQYHFTELEEMRRMDMRS